MLQACWTHAHKAGMYIEAVCACSLLVVRCIHVRLHLQAAAAEDFAASTVSKCPVFMRSVCAGAAIFSGAVCCLVRHVSVRTLCDLKTATETLSVEGPAPSTAPGKDPRRPGQSGRGSSARDRREPRQNVRVSDSVTAFKWDTGLDAEVDGFVEASVAGFFRPVQDLERVRADLSCVRICVRHLQMSYLKSFEGSKLRF